MGFRFYNINSLSPSLSEKSLRLYDDKRYYKFCLDYHRLVSIYYSIIGLDNDDED
jgi:hypothetical protein